MAGSTEGAANLVANAIYKLADTVSPGNNIAWGNALYFPDSSETDQGATGNGKSAKAYIDEINSNNATLVFVHNKALSITTYTFATSETIPDNITVIMEHGAILDGAGTLTQNGPFEAGPYQVFSGAGSVVTSQPVYVDWWGTDESAFDNAIAASRYVKLWPGNSYTITALAQITNGAQKIVCEGGQKYGTQVTYTNTTGNIIDIDADECLIEGFMIYGPGSGNTDIAIYLQNNTVRNTIRDMRIQNVSTGITDDGYANYIQNHFGYNADLHVDLGQGAQKSLRECYLSTENAYNANAVLVHTTGAVTTQKFIDCIFGACKQAVYLSYAAATDFYSCHWEGSTDYDLKVVSTNSWVGIHGGRMGGNKTDETIILPSSGGAGIDLRIDGTYFVANAEGQIDDKTGNVITVRGSNLASADFDTGNGTVIFLDKFAINDAGDISPRTITSSGFIQGDTIVTSGTQAVRYSRRIGTITNNSTTDTFKATVGSITVSGYVTVSALRAAESSSHIYQVHSDPGGVSLVEIGVGRNRDATVALTAAVAGTDLTFTIDTTADDWAGDDISVTVTADLSSASADITYTDL